MMTESPGHAKPINPASAARVAATMRETVEQAGAARPRGRPKVPDAARKRNNVTIRMRDELKSKVERSAAAQQRSMSEEIETRLEKSLADEDRFGGPEMLALVNLMAGSFARGAQLGARARGHPDWTLADQLADITCFRAGVHALIDALHAAMPRLEFGDDTPPDARRHADALHDFFSQIASRSPGSVKIETEDEK